MIEDFSQENPAEWRFVSDRVMGGVSQGAAQMLREGETTFTRLTGTVSTRNNGGFIQVRRGLDAGFPADSTGLRLRVRGNGEGYYVHLRPKGTLRPWRYFAAPFETNGAWQEVVLPWSAFSPQGGM